jgi:hypothetical protein
MDAELRELVGQVVAGARSWSDVATYFRDRGDPVGESCCRWLSASNKTPWVGAGDTSTYSWGYDGTNPCGIMGDVPRSLFRFLDTDRFGTCVASFNTYDRSPTYLSLTDAFLGLIDAYRRATQTTTRRDEGT